MMIARQRLRPLMVVLGFGVLSCGMILTPSSVAACSFIFPPWYTTTTMLQIPLLPAGLRLEEILDDPSRFAAKKLRITNTTAMPLYIIATFPTGETTFEPIAHQFPNGRGPTDKVAAGVASRWTPPWYSGQDHWTWEQQGPAVTLYLTHEEITTGDGAVVRFSNDVGPDRPVNASPPVPERRTIPLVYGTQLITVPLTVTYALNPAYDPTVGMQGCGDAGDDPALGLTIGSGVLTTGVLGWLIWWTMKRRQQHAHSE